jgi:hypothetical protein
LLQDGWALDQPSATSLKVALTRGRVPTRGRWAKREVNETRPARKRSFQNGRIAVAAVGCAREAAYHKEKG